MRSDWSLTFSSIANTASQATGFRYPGGGVTQGIIVFAHGSRIETANDAVRSVAAELARQGNFPHVAAAFLELGKPDLEGAVLHLTSQGARSIVVIPYFLTLGLHLERDLPRIIQEISNKYKELEVHVTPPLDGHPGLVQVLLDRLRNLT
jgi:sirohydrochlorin ferrochelatase